MNDAGYRDLTHAKTPAPGVHRVAFVGDSFTYGVGVTFDDTYPKRVERSLSALTGEPWEATIFAVPGVNTEQEARMVEDEVLGYAPEILVVGYVLNDAEDESSAERRRAAEWLEAEAERKSDPWWRHSALLRFGFDRIHATIENQRRIANHLALYEDGAPGFVASTRSLKRIASLCEERRIDLVVLLFPLFANPLDDSYPFRSIHQKLSRICQASGIRLVDTLPYYEGMDWRLLVVEGPADEHPNELAHRIAAQALLSALEPKLRRSSKSGAT